MEGPRARTAGPRYCPRSPPPASKICQQPSPRESLLGNTTCRRLCMPHELGSNRTRHSTTYMTCTYAFGEACNANHRSRVTVKPGDERSRSSTMLTPAKRMASARCKLASVRGCAIRADHAGAKRYRARAEGICITGSRRGSAREFLPTLGSKFHQFVINAGVRVYTSYTAGQAREGSDS